MTVLRKEILGLLFAGNFGRDFFKIAKYVVFQVLAAVKMWTLVMWV
jgi:hypothetical protein